MRSYFIVLSLIATSVIVGCEKKPAEAPKEGAAAPEGEKKADDKAAAPAEAAKVEAQKAPEQLAPPPAASPFALAKPTAPAAPEAPPQGQLPAPGPTGSAVAAGAQDGDKPANPVCNHAENPACAVHLDPKVAAEHGPALEIAGEKYGQGVTLVQSIKVSDLAADPEKYAGQRVRVEGEVEDVCRMRGCWFSMKSDVAGKTMKFKVTDGVMVFPTNAIGKHAVAEGMVRKMVLDLEQTKRVLEHEAQEQGRPFDAAKVTEPMTIVRIDGLGAVIRDKK